MRKVFYAFALLMVAAVAFTGCKKEQKEEAKIVKRLTQCGDKWDVYYFTYNADGKIAYSGPVSITAAQFTGTGTVTGVEK